MLMLADMTEQARSAKVRRELKCIAETVGLSEAGDAEIHPLESVSPFLYNPLSTVNGYAKLE